MMEKAEEKFAKLPSEDVVRYTYVVAPRMRWQGMLENPLCSFGLRIKLEGSVTTR